MKRIHLMILGLAVMAGLAPACGVSDGDHGAKVSVNAREASLAEVWEAVAEEAGFRESTANLEELMVWFRDAGTVYILQYIFHAADARGAAMTYTVNSDSSGEVLYYSREGAGVPTQTHPLDVFEELDGVSPERMLGGEAEAHLDMSFMQAAISFDGTAMCDGGPCELYELKNGELVPLKSVLFGTELYWGEISVARFADGAQTPSFSGIWFLTSELEKAEAVVYA